MNFTILLGITGSFLLAALIGVLIALVLMRPSVRNFCRKSLPGRIILSALTGLLLFIFIFGVSTRVLANNMYGVVSASFDAIQTKLQEDPALVKQLDNWNNNEPGIIKEIWLQQMMIPRSTYRCFAGDQNVCSLMQVIGISGASTWKTFPVFFALGFTGAAAFVLFASWMLKRYLQADTQTDENFHPRPRSKARQL